MKANYILLLFWIVLTCQACHSIAIASIDLDDPTEPWKTAKVGITTKVPPPFEELKKNGATIKCWGRKYFVKGPFPVGINGMGKQISGPIQMKMRIGKGPTTPLVAQEKFTLERPDRIEWKAAGRVSTIKWSSESWIEYDGVVQVRITLKSDRETVVNYLGIDIPLSPSFELYHAHTTWGKFLNGGISKGNGVKVNEPWLACWWLGDDYRGLTFLTETKAGWTNSKDNFQIIRNAKNVTLRVNIWNEPEKFIGERTFVFGLQATPTKPLPFDWHGRHFGQYMPSKHVNIRHVWFWATKGFSYPQEAEPGFLKKYVQKHRTEGATWVPLYITPSGTEPLQAEKRNHEDWLLDDGDGKPVFYDGEVERFQRTLTGVCPASSYTDWMAWGIHQAINEYDIDGVWVDNANPYPCRNKRHGCGTGGHPTYPYFANRRWHKRLYTIIRELKPKQGIVFEHTSRYLNSFALSFVDIYSDGEQFRDKKKDKWAISLDNITPEFMRIGFTGRQWGAQPSFMPSLVAGRQEYTDWLLARTLPFGNVPWINYAWMDGSRHFPVLRARHKFGLGREKVQWFTPLDKTPAWLSMGPRHLLAGGYERKDGGILLTISNLQSEPENAVIDTGPIIQKFGHDFAIWDATTNTSITYKGKIQLLVPPNSFRLLRIGKTAKEID